MGVRRSPGHQIYGTPAPSKRHFRHLHAWAGRQYLSRLAGDRHKATIRHGASPGAAKRQLDQIIGVTDGWELYLGPIREKQDEITGEFPYRYLNNFLCYSVATWSRRPEMTIKLLRYRDLTGRTGDFCTFQQCQRVVIIYAQHVQKYVNSPSFSA